MGWLADWMKPSDTLRITLKRREQPVAAIYKDNVREVRTVAPGEAVDAAPVRKP